MRVHIYETLQKLGMMMQNGSLNCLAVKNFNLKNLKGQTAAILKSRYLTMQSSLSSESAVRHLGI